MKIFLVVILILIIFSNTKIKIEKYQNGNIKSIAPSYTFNYFIETCIVIYLIIQ